MEEKVRSSGCNTTPVSRERVSVIYERIRQEEFLLQMLDAFPDVVLLLNGARQIVYANHRLDEYFGLSVTGVLGKAPGELFGCLNAQKEGGCGRQDGCHECGFVNSVIAVHEKGTSTEECRLSIRSQSRTGALDLRIWAAPLVIGGECFIVCTIQDIAHIKRNEILQRTFFHDILNALSSVFLYLENIYAGIMEPDARTIGDIRTMVLLVVDDIKAQRDLLAAERNELETVEEDVPIHAFLKTLVRLYEVRKSSKNCAVVLDCPIESGSVRSDKVLLGRVIGNLIKNALEATLEEGTITVQYRRNEQAHFFSVHNPAAIPPHIQTHIFERSFSTKGKGHGIGTYSSKFLTETYLRGNVSFESSPETGTRFTVTLPVHTVH